MATTFGFNMISAITILVIGWLAAEWTANATKKALGKARDIDVTPQKFFASLVK
ncbi:MAG: hypothetical protein VW547_15180 [Alphaproteobacteria bacterium]